MQLIEINNNTYRQCDVRYNGVKVTALILESEYQKARAEKQSHKRPKTKRKEIEKLLDDAWSEKVKENANYTCEYCGATDKQLNSHHIFSRKNKATRWHLDNGICLCVGCHTFGAHSAHVDPVGFMRWLRPYRGDARIGQLEMAKSRSSYTVQELEFLLKKLK